MDKPGERSADLLDAAGHSFDKRVRGHAHRARAATGPWHSPLTRTAPAVHAPHQAG